MTSEREIAVKNAVMHFENLLKSQIERADRIKAEKAAVRPQSAKKIIGICNGDGIGPIITKSAEKVLRHLLSDEIKNGKVQIVNIEGLTIENRVKLQKSVPDDVLQEIKKCDVLLKGPTETQKGGTLESANVTLRRELDLFANVRPIKIPNLNIDWTFFRENTEGEYVLGSCGAEIPDTLAFDFKVTTVEGTSRIARTAFDFAAKNGKHSVSIVTKANIMKKTDGMFSEICHEIAKDYPDISAEDWYVDIMSANLINSQIRDKLEVFVMPNLYGDILTDEAAQIQGGVGTAGSANIGDRYAMFEAIHGTAPRLMEMGLGDYADPTSILRASEMLLSHIGFYDKAQKLKAAVDTAAKTTRVTGNSNGATCEEFTQSILKLL